MTDFPAPDECSAGPCRLDEQAIAAFRTMIYRTCPVEERPMPWRETRDPYCILVSEVMLQQTQVERVSRKYPEFLEAFPTLHTLAEAPLARLLAVWQGLGYNRRALALQRCAEAIVSRYGGIFPTAPAELETLPGIGPYTARAVAAFAFDVAEPLIETNIRTVFLHHFFHGQAQVHDRELMPLIAATLDKEDPRRWYYALMDYGVLLKRSHPNPGRQSRHHVRQSRFEGSNRQLRSRLLRLILDHPGITRKQIMQEVVADEAAVQRNLAVLCAEGFLQRSGRGYGVCDGTTKRG